MYYSCCWKPISNGDKKAHELVCVRLRACVRERECVSWWAHTCVINISAVLDIQSSQERLLQDFLVTKYLLQKPKCSRLIMLEVIFSFVFKLFNDTRSVVCTMALWFFHSSLDNLVFYVIQAKKNNVFEESLLTPCCRKYTLHLKFPCKKPKFTSYIFFLSMQLKFKYLSFLICRFGNVVLKAEL